MSIGEKLTKEVMAWGTLAIVIVIVCVVLLKFKSVSGVTAGLNTTIDTFVTGLSEPRNWVIIVVIAVVGFSILALFLKKGKKGGY